MITTRPPLLRRLMPWLLGLALVGFTALSLGRILSLRSELRASVEDQLQAQLQDRVAAWEERLLEQVSSWLDNIASDPKQASKRQQQLRQRERWADSVYLWVPPRSVQIAGRQLKKDPYFIFPAAPALEHTESILARPCLARARLLSRDPTIDAISIGRAYRVWCRAEDLPVRLVASTEAATLLTRANHPVEALAALQVEGFDNTMTLRNGVANGLSPFRLVIHRTQRAGLLRDLGNEEQALDLLYTTGLEVTSLDGPEAQPLLQFVNWPIIAQLDKHGRSKQARSLKLMVEQAQRRVRAFREIAERILPNQPSSSASDAPRFIYDQYAETPFLLFYGWIQEGRLGAALQLDQPMLLQDFLSSLRRLRKHVVITDAGGTRVAGPRKGGPVRIEVPFSMTLTHLRVGMRQSAIDARTARLDDQWIAPTVVTLLCVLIGFAALWGQVQSARQQRELLERQRAFTTRVTHELKTPLAGIRIMAENLESGAWHNPDQAGEMATRIIDEADRLSERVDEILAVARRRTIPRPEPFDTEEALLDAVEAWGPRLERAGVRLHADLEMTDHVMGDGRALTDAVACLLDNALKYHRDDHDDPQVWLTLHQEGRSVLIDVADNGLGVPAKMRKDIFSRFVRVEGPNRGKSGGHGLGLAQVAEIVAAHRGKVVCTEGVEGGARFTISLPHV